MLNEDEARDVIGKTVYSGEGEKIGKAGQVFLDDQTGRPEFMTVNTGLFGTSESFVPLAGASLNGDNDVTVPFSKSQVKDAPRVDLDSGHLDEADEQRLYQHYDRTDRTVADADRSGSDDDYNAQGRTSGRRTDDRGTGDLDTDDLGRGNLGAGDFAAGDNTTGTTRSTTDAAMTRSEEHLEAGTQTEQVGRARLRKYVTTENETVTVPVRKERAVLETEPVTGSNVDEATAGPDISEDEHEVVLEEQRVVVDKVTEPVERVRLGTETVTDQETVSDEVRKENIEVEGDIDDRRR